MKELESTFQKVRYVGWERSYTPHIDREKKTMQYFISWNKEEEIGAFEIYDIESGGNDYYAGGGLWFTKDKLDDYDGVFCLDEEVINCLKKWGADVSEL